MSPILRNVLAVVAGFFLGSAVHAPGTLVGAYQPMGWLGGRLAAGPGAAAVESR